MLVLLFIPDGRRSSVNCSVCGLIVIQRDLSLRGQMTLYIPSLAQIACAEQTSRRILDHHQLHDLAWRFWWVFPPVILWTHLAADPSFLCWYSFIFFPPCLLWRGHTLKFWELRGICLGSELYNYFPGDWTARKLHILYVCLKRT